MLEKGVKDNKWNLVTGDSQIPSELAIKSYLAVKTVVTEDRRYESHT